MGKDSLPNSLLLRNPINTNLMNKYVIYIDLPTTIAIYYTVNKLLQTNQYLPESFSDSYKFTKIMHC